MANRTSLVQLISQLRAEIGASPSSSQNVNAVEGWKHLLRRTQEMLYDDFNWPQLIIERDEPLKAGERYYTFDPAMNFNRIMADYTKVRYSGTWRPVGYGFDSAVYNAANSDAGVRQNPVRLWRHYEENQFEVWPVPADDTQFLRFRAVRKLSPLVNDDDRADLDDMLIVLFAAAELLTRMKSDDAGPKMRLATSRYNRLKARNMKSGTIIMGGGAPSMNPCRDRVIWGAPIVDGNPNPA